MNDGPRPRGIATRAHTGIGVRASRSAQRPGSDRRRDVAEGEGDGQEEDCADLGDHGELDRGAKPRFLPAEQPMPIAHGEAAESKHRDDDAGQQRRAAAIGEW